MFGCLQRIRRNDAVFGPMLYMGDKAGYWEAETLFSPTGHKIELFVDGPSDDNMVLQHEFFKTLCLRWTEIIAAVRSLDRTHKCDALTVTSITIPKSQSFDTAEWELSFGDSYTATMKGVVAQDITWSC